MLSSLAYIAIFLLNYVDFKGLFCQSRDLVESLMPGNETPFCIISGTTATATHTVQVFVKLGCIIIFVNNYAPTFYSLSQLQHGSTSAPR